MLYRKTTISHRYLEELPAEITARPAEHAKILQSRCDWLTGTDRVLMELVLTAGCRNQTLAVLTGRSQSTLTRRIRRLTEGLSGRRALLPADRVKISALEKAIARQAILEGHSITRIVRVTGLSRYRVRKILDTLKSPHCQNRSA
jgi:IS30 family transposase